MTTQILAVCLTVTAAQLDSPLPPRLQIPGSEPVPGPVVQRVPQYRRPAAVRAYQPRDEGPPGPAPPVRVRRPVSRARPPAQPLPQPVVQSKQDSLSIRPVNEDPENDYQPVQPQREVHESNAIPSSSQKSPPPSPAPAPQSATPATPVNQPQPAPSVQVPSQVLTSPHVQPQAQQPGPGGRALANNRPVFLQPAVFRPSLPARPATFRPSQPVNAANDDDNAILQPKQQVNPRAYLPTGSPPSPTPPVFVTTPSSRDDAPSYAKQTLQRPLFRGQLGQLHHPPPPSQTALLPPPGQPLTQLPAVQVQLAQQLAAQQAAHQAVQQLQKATPSPSPSPQPVPSTTPNAPQAVRNNDNDDDDDDDGPLYTNNRRQSFKVTPNYLVTPSTLDLDDDIPQLFTTGPQRRPQVRPSPIGPTPSSVPFELQSNAFSPSPRPQQAPRRPSPPPPSSPSSPPPRRTIVAFRPERVNQVTAAPAQHNVHVQQLLREDDDYRPLVRTTASPPRQPSRPSAPIQPRPRPQGSAGKGHQRERKPVAQVLRRYREDNPDGSITWGYENDDGSFKEETIGVDCMVRGKYGYIDPEGNRREYTYQSGIPCTPSPPGQESDDQEGGYVDYQNNQYVLPNGQSISLDEMVKNRKRKPVNKLRV